VTIDAKQAAAALGEIESIAHRVKQSRFYQFASWMLVLWGGLTAAGYVATFLWPRFASYAWSAVYVAGIAGSFAISAVNRSRSGVRTFDLRTFFALLLFVGFGIFVVAGLGHFGPRELGAFWPIYFMLAYTVVGLWVGPAFVAIGLSIAALTLIGYVLAGPWFDLWMAAVNGGGLVLGGLWMRRS
jgi:hypothetical protein